MKYHYLLLTLLYCQVLNRTLRPVSEKKSFEIVGDLRWEFVTTSSAGDVNGDGYTDMFMSTSPHPHGTKGYAYLVYGGPTESLNTFEVDIMTPRQGFKIRNDHEDSRFMSISSADMNNDGYSDLILVGVNNSNDAAILYVIFGGTSLSDINVDHMSNSQGFTITGLMSHEYTYIIVNSAGDVNGDSYQDIIVSVSLRDKQNQKGVLVIYGGSSLASFNISEMTSSQGFTIAAEATWGASFGTSVSSAGDINKDGYADLLIVGSDDYSESQCKYIFAVYGGKSLSDLNVMNMTSEQGFNISTCNHGSFFFGTTACSAGDVNGDGYADILISLPQENYSIGTVYIIYGGAELTSFDLTHIKKEQGIRIAGYSRFSPLYFGEGLSSAGDFNGDGYADVIIGAPEEGEHHDTGIVYIIYGGKSLSSFSVMNMTPSQGLVVNNPGINGYYFGRSVSTVRDVNNDGYADVIISMEHDKNPTPGAAYVLFGRPNAS